MAYPDTPATVSEMQDNPVLNRELCEAFNKKSKEGIKRIQEICEKNGLDESTQRKELAKFFLNNKSNLNLVEVGDYLSGPDDAQKEVLKHFTSECEASMKGQDFGQAMRDYLGRMRMPGEGQKVERLMEAFAGAYVRQNPDSGFANSDAAYMTAVAGMMFATSAHNPSVRKEDKITLKSAQRMLPDCDPEFVKSFHQNMTSKPFEVTFLEKEPSFEVSSANLKNDRLFQAVDRELGGKKPDLAKQFGVEGGTATANQKKPMLGFLTGYKSTVTVTDKDGNKANVEISKPGIFSRNQPSVVIKPEGGSPGSLDLASQIASRLETPVTCKATYGYQRDDMAQQVAQQKQGVKTGPKAGKEVEKSQSVAKNEPKESVEVDRVQLSSEGLQAKESPKVDTAAKVGLPEISGMVAKRKEQFESLGKENSVGATTGLKKPGERGTGKDLQVKQGQGKGVS